MSTDIRRAPFTAILKYGAAPGIILALFWPPAWFILLAVFVLVFVLER